MQCVFSFNHLSTERQVVCSIAFYVILVDACAQGNDFESGFRLFGGLVDYG